MSFLQPLDSELKRRERRKMEKEDGEAYVLEINLISAQGLREPSARAGRMRSYAVAWVDPSAKLRTRVDRVGGENPIWNEKFLFKVNSEFLSKETSGVNVKIYSVGVFRDKLIGSVRFLIRNVLPSPASTAAFTTAMKTPSLTALQIHRPSGRFYGVINFGVMVLDSSDVPEMSRVSAIGYRDLKEKSHALQGRRGSLKKCTSSVGEYGVVGSHAISFRDSDGQSDGDDSIASSSPNVALALKEWNIMLQESGGKNRLRSSSDDGGVLSGMLVNKRNNKLGPSRFS